jgi:hypothetical protein
VEDGVREVVAETFEYLETTGETIETDGPPRMQMILSGSYASARDSEAMLPPSPGTGSVHDAG